MTTQSPHLYERQSRPAAVRDAGRPSKAQTRLPWWAVALPVAAFAVLLALLSTGTANASTAASGGELFGRIAAVLDHLLRQLF